MKHRVVSGISKSTSFLIKFERVILIFIFKCLNYSLSTFMFPRLILGFCSERCFLPYYIWYFKVCAILPGKHIQPESLYLVFCQSFTKNLLFMSSFLLWLIVNICIWNASRYSHGNLFHCFLLCLLTLHEYLCLIIFSYGYAMEILCRCSFSMYFKMNFLLLHNTVCWM